MCSFCKSESNVLKNPCFRKQVSISIPISISHRIKTLAPNSKFITASEEVVHSHIFSIEIPRKIKSSTNIQFVSQRKTHNFMHSYKADSTPTQANYIKRYTESNSSSDFLSLYTFAFSTITKTFGEKKVKN